MKISRHNLIHFIVWESLIDNRRPPKKRRFNQQSINCLQSNGILIYASFIIDSYKFIGNFRIWMFDMINDHGTRTKKLYTKIEQFLLNINWDARPFHFCLSFSRICTMYVHCTFIISNVFYFIIYCHYTIYKCHTVISIIICEEKKKLNNIEI